MYANICFKSYLQLIRIKNKAILKKKLQILYNGKRWNKAKLLSRQVISFKRFFPAPNGDSNVISNVIISVGNLKCITSLRKT